jgi:hypothetical protein
MKCKLVNAVDHENNESHNSRKSLPSEATSMPLQTKCKPGIITNHCLQSSANPKNNSSMQHAILHNPREAVEYSTASPSNYSYIATG